MKIVRIGIQGAGFMGGIHGKNLFSMEGVKICGVCDRNIGLAQALAEQLETTAYGSYEEMLENEALDAVYICIPPFSHHGEVEKAAEKNIHVFIEKPISISTEQAKSMVNASKHIFTQVGYHQRFGGAVVEVKKMLDEGVAGKPVLFSGRYECNSLHTPWWRDKNKSGSQILEQVIHTYDMAMYFMGKPSEAVGFCGNICHKEVDGYTVEDVSAASVKFESGALATISATNCAVPMQWNNPYTLVCENMTVHFTDPNHATVIKIVDGEGIESQLSYSTDMYLEEDKVFIETLRGLRMNQCTINEGYESLKLAVGVVKSAENEGEKVTF